MPVSFSLIRHNLPASSGALAEKESGARRDGRRQLLIYMKPDS